MTRNGQERGRLARGFVGVPASAGTTRSWPKLEFQPAGGPPALLLPGSAVGNYSCRSSLVTCHRFRCVLVFPGDEENQSDAGADGGVGDVEGGEANFMAAAWYHVKADEVHDFMADQPVGEIARNAAEQQAEGDLAGQFVRVEMVPREKERDEGEEHDDDERAVVAAEEAPRRAGVAPVNELEKAADDDLFLECRQPFQHQPLGELVERKDRQRERGNAAVRFLENSFGG